MPLWFTLIDTGERRRGKRRFTGIASNNLEDAHETARLNTEPCAHTYVVEVKAMYSANAPNPIVHEVKIPD
jgi:hypothetical protein